MDAKVASLPPAVRALLMENIGIIQIVSMYSIGAYGALETGLFTFHFFRKYGGLYFWSMQAASWGILVHALPAMARFISQSSNLPTSIPFVLGWYAMVTGQAVVLYSRLHLLAPIECKTRWILWMIVVNAFILHVPMTVLFFGLNSGVAGFARPAAIFDRIQLIGFCIQDLVICSIYIYHTVLLLKSSRNLHRTGSRKVLVNIICVNIMVVLMNILLLVTEFKLHYIQVSFKTVAYSIKLKLEFSVLNEFRSFFSKSIYLDTSEIKIQSHQDDTSSSNVRLNHSNATSGEVRHMPQRSSGAQAQLQYNDSLHETRDNSHQSVDVISPPSSLSDDNSEQKFDDWPGFSGDLELSLSQISSKSDI
ncbi:hypothetical protein N7481_008457 [Penicillium waksmanii]|uniref:uncharacterized protein n=1 Tax=Penicillium waksmanii TaxID=69791 RepID=UPI0025490E9A|nr:uncharacterized protein N7481_008457 [Penicillium waksmanii]KAJ5974750.1 hypothetical protein N7481_008457 [Penicillium waksmanii]